MNFVDIITPVNWFNPLNRGLQFWGLCLPGLMSGSRLINLVRPGNSDYYHGVLTGMVPGTSGFGATNRFGGYGSLYFDGVDDHIESDSAIISNMPVTFSAWVKPNSVELGIVGTFVSISKVDESNHYWVLRQSGPNLESRSRAGGTGASSTATTLTTEWQHVVGVFSSTTSRTTYINGIQGTINSTTRNPIGMDRTTIGYGYGADNNFFDGQIDDVRIYNRVLSTFEVNQLYHQSMFGNIELLNYVQLDLVGNIQTTIGSPWYYNLQQAS